MTPPSNFIPRIIVEEDCKLVRILNANHADAAAASGLKHTMIRLGGKSALIIDEEKEMRHCRHHIWSGSSHGTDGHTVFLLEGSGLAKLKRFASVGKAAKSVLALATIVIPIFYSAPGLAENIFSDLGRSVKKGVRETGRAIGHGAHETGKAIKKGAHQVGRTIHRSSPGNDNRRVE